MSVTSTNKETAAPTGAKRKTSLVHLLLEGRAFFALIAIIAVFSFLSPYYFTVDNFLIMSSHVAIFGLLAIGMLLVILNGVAASTFRSAPRWGWPVWSRAS